MWLKEIERIFRVIDCAENLKVRYGTHMLSEEVDDWWIATKTELDTDEIEITWVVFKRKEIEFMELKQDNMTVPGYAANFVELAKYYTPYINDEAGEFLKCIKFENGLRDDIKHGKKHMGRGKPYGRGKAVDRNKPSGGDSSAFVRCYNCGEIGHRKNDCKLDRKKCFKCDKVAHITADSPPLSVSLSRGGLTLTVNDNNNKEVSDSWSSLSIYLALTLAEQQQQQ
ncbi:uncharacterized protein LOC131630406 [Vicia villosa]|uniref:uncharacterized protein LOC131630406 n=1 Tax=Vicia villosa TaxID=3911 RepID=UPI00273C04A8|nr:uncharacterized protein LOC131630406 [Vicia villosa]